MRYPIRMAVSATVVLAAVLTSAPAFADPSPTPLPARLDAAKQVVTARIDGRLATLHALSTAVTAAQRLTASHKSTLSTLITTDESGLNTLRTKVSGETTLAGVRADD